MKLYWLQQTDAISFSCSRLFNDHVIIRQLPILNGMLFRSCTVIVKILLNFSIRSGSPTQSLCLRKQHLCTIYLFFPSENSLASFPSCLPLTSTSEKVSNSTYTALFIIRQIVWEVQLQHFLLWHLKCLILMKALIIWKKYHAIHNSVAHFKFHWEEQNTITNTMVISAYLVIVFWSQNAGLQSFYTYENTLVNLLFICDAGDGISCVNIHNIHIIINKNINILCIVHIM